MTFDLRSLDIGTYSVRLTKGTTSETILVPNSLDVVFATINVQPISLTRPDTFNRRRGDRPPAAIPVTIGWRNNTLNDIPVPLVHFSATDPFASTLEDANTGKTVFAKEFLGFTDSDGPKDILLAGESSSASFYVKPKQVSADTPPIDIHYVAEYFYDDAAASYNWDFDLSQLDLSYLNDDEALEAIQAFKAARGETVGALRQVLVEGLRRSGDLSPVKVEEASRFLLQEVFDRFVAERHTSITGAVTANSLAVPYKGLVVTLAEVGGSQTYSSRVLADGSFVFPKLPAADYVVTVSGGAVKAPNGTQINLAAGQHAQVSIQLESSLATAPAPVPMRVPSGVSNYSAPWITRPGKINEPLSGNVLETILPQLAGVPFRVEIIGGAPVGFSLSSDGTYRYLSSQTSAFVVHYDLVTPDNETRVGRLFNAEIRSRGVIAITLKNNATRDVRSADPNDIIGPIGFGAERWVSAAERLPYTIRFENDPQNATSPAQLVVIEQILDSDLDTNSFQFGNFGFGGREYQVPSGRQTLSLDIDLKAEIGIIVRVFARIDPAQRKVTWTFRSISPATGTDTTNPSDGFLPLNLLPPQGDGFVSYSIRAKKSAPSGSLINARARIIFDGNSAIDTPEIFNTLDSTKPLSAFASADPIPSEQKLRVKWTGDDGEIGAGLNVFDVYVSENNGRYRPWLQNTQLFEAEFPTVGAMTYDFITIARDNVGNNEEDTKIPDAHRPTAKAGGPYTAIEGKPVQLTGSGQDPDFGQTVSFEWDFDYDGFTFNVDSTVQSPQVTFGDGPSTRTIGLRTKDSGALPLYSVVATTTVAVSNVVPNLTVAKSTVSGLVTTSFANNGTWSDVADDLVSLTASLGSVTKNNDGTWVWSYSPTAIVTNQTVTIVAKDKDDGSTSVSFLITADGISVTSTISSSNSSGAIYGQAVDFTVKLTSTIGVPTGFVQFQVNGVNFGQPVAVQAGQATISIPGLPAGSHQIVAVFTDPNSVFVNHTSAPFTQTIAKAQLSVTTAATEIFVGDSLPTFVALYSGFVNGDSSSGALSGAPTFSVPANANLTAGQYTITALQGSLSSNNYSFQFQNSQLTVTNRILTLSTSTPQISENGGKATFTVTRNTPTTADLLVNLSSSDLSEAEVPSTIIIPAGASSATFTVSAIDDLIADGDQLANITATASGFLSATSVLTVTDNETATLQLTLDKTVVSENAGSLLATVTRNTPTTSALAVTLANSNPAVGSVPGTVTILPGETSATFLISIADDNLADGDQLSEITASANGLMNAVASFTVTDNERPTLVLSLASGSILENGGSTSGTLTRNTPTTSALTVNLSGNDNGSIRFPAFVTFLAGASTASFTIESIDDSIADGNQVINLVADTNGFVAGSAVLTVTDDEVATLSLTLAATSMAENGGSTTGTVSRNTPTNTPLVVNLSSNNPSSVRLQETVTIPAGASFATFPIESIDDSIADGDLTLVVTVASNGLSNGTASLKITDNEARSLSLSLSPTTIAENGGSLTGTVTRNTPTTDAILVTLVSNNSASVRLPETVTIPAGANSATFILESIDDLVADGTQVVSISAEVSGFASGTGVVTITDNETATLSLTLPSASFSENGAGLIATVARNTPTTNPLVVKLVSSNPLIAKVQGTVTIPAGALTATFQILPDDDQVAAGNQTSLITASFDGFESASALVTVIDDDVATLLVTLSQSSISENGGQTTGTVTRNTPTNSDLIVTLSSSDTTEATVLPSTVTILAGANSASFTVNAVNETLADGNQIATLSVAATGFETATANVTVVDDDVAALTLVFAQTSISENGGTTSATITRNTPTTEELLVSLSNSLPSAVDVPASVRIPAGQASATFAVVARNNQTYSGNVLARIQASAPAFASSEATLQINEDDPNHPWNNALNVYDVNADRRVSPIDALLVINFLNAGYRGVLPTPKPGELPPPPYVDVNADDVLSPIDALLVINYLNKQTAAAEGESVAVEQSPAIEHVDQLLFDSTWLDDVVNDSRNRRIRTRNPS